jgi:hypothetical protein
LQTWLSDGEDDDDDERFEDLWQAVINFPVPKRISDPGVEMPTKKAVSDEHAA